MAQQQQFAYNPVRPGGGRVGMQPGGYVQHPARGQMHAMPPGQQQQPGRPMQALQRPPNRPLQQQQQRQQQPPRQGTVMHYGQGMQPHPTGMQPHPTGRQGIRPSYVPQQQPMPQQQGQHSIQIQRVPNTLHMQPGLSMANTRRLSHDPESPTTRDIPSPHLRGGFPPSSPSLADLGHIDLNNRPPQVLGDHNMPVSRPQMMPHQDMPVNRGNIMRTNMNDFHNINPKLQQDNNGMLLRVDTNGLHRVAPGNGYGMHMNGDPRSKAQVPPFLHGLSDLDMIDEDILARLIIELGLDRMRELPELWLSHNELEMDICRQVPPQRAVRC